MRLPSCSSQSPLRFILAGILLIGPALLAETVTQSSAHDSSFSDPVLQKKVEQEHGALSAGEPSAIIASARSLVAAALLRMGDLRMGERKWSEASDLYRTSLSVDPSPETQAALDRAAHHSAPSNHQPEERSRAREGHLRTVLATGYLDWGVAVARGGNIAGARQLFEEASHWDPTVPGVMSNLGLAAFRTGDFQRSAEAFGLVLASKPGDQQSRIFLGLSLFSLKQFQEAVAAFTPIESQLTDNSQAAYAFAFSLAQTGAPQHANYILDQLSVQALPPAELALVCQVYAQTENYEQAVTCLQHVTQQDPTLPHVHYQEGVALIRLNRPAAAVPALRQELTIDDSDADARFYLAYALLQLSEKDEAKSELTTVVTQRPQQAQAQYELGKLLLEQGDVPGAIAHLEVAVQVSPDDYFAHYQLQNAYRKAGRTNEAAEQLRLYREIKEKHRESELQKP